MPRNGSKPTKEQKAKYNATRKAKYKDNPEVLRVQAANFYRKRCGWTAELYEQKKKEQNNLCAICEKPQTYKALAADHEHSVPPKPRGLLCEKCNIGLGMFDEESALLRKAEDYIEKYRTQKTQN
jgi:hypothetical protein